MNWNWLLNFSTVFRDLCIGVGALVGSAGAVKVILDWRKEINSRNYRNRWKDRFSKPRFENSEVALYKLSTSDRIYGIDKADNEKWWIKPLSTLHALGYTGEDAKTVSKTELEKYDEGKAIDFRDYE